MLRKCGEGFLRCNQLIKDNALQNMQDACKMEVKMSNYEAPFDITDRILSQVASIFEKVGRYQAHGDAMWPHLRRSNQIRSVYSSLRIEANSLSLDEVRDVVARQSVMGPEKIDNEEARKKSVISSIVSSVGMLFWHLNGGTRHGK